MKIHTTAAPLKPRIVIYGHEGVGKTGFAAQFPSPIFGVTAREDGLATLIRAGLAPADTPHTDPMATWGDVMQFVGYLLTGEHSHKWCVFDTIGGVGQLYYDWVLNSEFGGSADKFSAFGKDKAYHHKGWRDLITILDQIRTVRGMGFVCLAHATAAKHRNTEGADFERTVARFPLAPLWDAVYAWSDVVGYAKFDDVAVKESDSPGARSKGRGGKTRTIYFERSPGFDAKSRLTLPPSLPMGGSAHEAFQNFMAAYRAGIPAVAAKPVAATPAAVLVPLPRVETIAEIVAVLDDPMRGDAEELRQPELRPEESPF